MAHMSTHRSRYSPTFSPLILADSFTAANGTGNNGRAPDIVNVPGAAWATITGTIDIQSNQLNPATYASNMVKATLDPKRYNGRIFVTYQKGQTSGVWDFTQLFFRHQDATNFWCLTAGKLNNVDTFKIQETIDNVTTDRATAAVTFTDNKVHVLRLDFNGPYIVATCDGANEISYGSAATLLNVTTVGILLFQTAIITNKPRLDDFAFYDLT
jgi:hypothetical protein